MKSLKGLLCAVLADASAACSVRTSRDEVTISSRLEHEGLGFLTKTLPALGDWFDQSLEAGYVLNQTAFTKRPNESLPAFLSGLTGLVFHSDGKLRSPGSIDPNAVLYVRQICRMFKKMRIDCSPTIVRSTIDGFVTRDAEVGAHSASGVQAISKDILEHCYRRVCRIVTSDILSGFGPEVLLPRHGPGSVAEGATSPGSKYQRGIWTDRLESCLPFTEFLMPNLGWVGIGAQDGGWDFTHLAPDQEPPVRVVTVPKTQKGPRVIAMEPTHMQYAQQAIAGWLIPRIESGRYTGGHVNFQRQEVNAGLAMLSSRTQQLSTIDLSEASDRVSLALVEDLLGVNPALKEAVLAARSQTADVPGHGVIRLRKFAAMGSALCFPIESLVFYCLAVAAILTESNVRITPRSVKAAGRDVYVYGDDIIAPVQRTDCVISSLELVGLKVNLSKSYQRGHFRESCGTDAFYGYRVTPVYVRELLGHGRPQRGFVSWISLRNQLYVAGMWAAARYVQKTVETTYGAQPYVQPTSPGLGWFSRLGYDVHKTSRDTQSPLVKAWTVKPVYTADHLDSGPALMKCFLNPSREKDPLHLERSVMHGAIRIQRRWIPPF